MVTSHKFLADWRELTRTNSVTNLNLARALRYADLFTRARPGNAHRFSHVTCRHLSNYILAQAAAQASDGPEVVRRLREMVKVGLHVPSEFGPGNFGDVMDRIIGGVPVGSELADTIAKAKMPHEIRLMTSPYMATFGWLGSDNKPRGETFTSPESTTVTSTYPLLRVTFIYPALIELARKMLAEPSEETRNAARPRAALHVDQPMAHTTDKSGTSRSDPTPRVCVSSSPETDTATELELCHNVSD